MSASAILERDIIQGNPLIHARKEMNLTELRLFALGLQDIIPVIVNDVVTDLRFKETMISHKDLAELFGEKNNGNIVNLKKQLEKAYDSKIKLSYNDGGFGFRHIYRKIDYIPQSGLVITFDDEIKKYLVEIINYSYTKYKLKALFSLQSAYAWRLLETILENQGFFKKGKKKIYKIMTIDEIRFQLNVADGLYKGRMNNFKRKVIDEPIKDINKKTDYNVTYDVIKNGRKTTGFKFWLEMKEKKEALPAPATSENESESIETQLERDGQTRLFDPATNEPPSPAVTGLTEDQEELIDRLINRGVSAERSKKIVAEYPPDVIKSNLKYAVRQKDMAKNLPGLIIKFIEEDVAGKQEKAKKEAKEKEAKRQRERRQSYGIVDGKMEEDEVEKIDLENISPEFKKYLKN